MKKTINNKQMWMETKVQNKNMEELKAEGREYKPAQMCLRI